MGIDDVSSKGNLGEPSCRRSGFYHDGCARLFPAGALIRACSNLTSGYSAALYSSDDRANLTDVGNPALTPGCRQGRRHGQARREKSRSERCLGRSSGASRPCRSLTNSLSPAGKFALFSPSGGDLFALSRIIAGGRMVLENSLTEFRSVSGGVGQLMPLHGLLRICLSGDHNSPRFDKRSA